MNQICIAKKVSHNNIEFLDFAVNDNDCLLVFNTFKEASEFLKSEVGTGEQLLDFIITTTEAQASNPRMKELLEKGVVGVGQPVEEKPQLTVVEEAPANKSEFECMFVIEGSDFEIINHHKILDKATNRVLVPVLAFFDEKDPSMPAVTENFALSAVFVDLSETSHG